jgi:hypothetical protein
VVTRDEFINNYSGILAETSVGPFYTINWNIEGQAVQNSVLIINTDEGNTLFFDLATAQFVSEIDVSNGYQVSTFMPFNAGENDSWFSSLIFITIILIAAMNLALIVLLRKKMKRE